MAFGKYRLDDVQVRQDALVIRGVPVEWRYIGSLEGRPLATGRSLPWAIVRLVPAIPLFLYGVSYVIYANLGAPYRFAEWSVLATGGIFALLGLLLGGRPVVTCWQYGRYALTINVAGWRKPVDIRSRRRLAVAARERDINAILGRPVVSSQTNHYDLRWSQGVQFGNGNTQYNTFRQQRPTGS